MTCDMRLGRILGLPAVVNARIVGHVERAVPDPTGHHLQGFIIRRGLGGAKWADRSMVSVLGEVSVILREKPGRVPRGSAHLLPAVKDEGGLTLGRITDWWISRDSLDITGIEITLGPLADLTTGRCLVRKWAVQPAEDGMQLLIPRAEWEGKGGDRNEQAIAGCVHGPDDGHGADDVPHGQEPEQGYAKGHDEGPTHRPPHGAHVS